MSYAPRPVPGNDPAVLAQWMQDELQAIGRSFREIEILQLRVLNVAPKRPREGMIAYADGTNWNPGSGAGPYAYIGGVWTKLKP